MSAAELAEHLGYWNDEAKIAAYSAALSEVVSSDSTVLDLGTGTGLLGLLAARAGAKKVWAYDRGEIVSVARKIARHNGYDDQIEFVRALTTEVSLPDVDVVVCDQIGGLAFDAGILDFYADVKRRSSSPRCTFVPSSFDLYLAPVEALEPYRQVSDWAVETAGFDTSPVTAIAANTDLTVFAEQLTLRAPGAKFASIASTDDSAIKGSCTWTAEGDGVVHGYAGWFEASMSPSVTMTNSPVAAGRIQRWLNFYPLCEPRDVTDGDRLDASIDIRPSARLVTWTSSIAGTSSEQHSTFYGAFGRGVAPDPSSNRHPSERADVVRELLALAEAGASKGELVGACKQHSALFPTDEAAKNFAHRVAALL